MDEIFKNNTYRILELFIDFPTKDFSVRGIARHLKLSHATVLKYINDLEKLGFVKIPIDQRGYMIVDLIEEKVKKSLFRDPSVVKTVSFRNPGTQIDLGGIGKGYAVDMAVRVLKGNGINSVLINFAGNIYAYGTPPGKDSWVIGLQHPRKSEGLLGSFEIADKAVSTSGDYEKFFTIDGERYSHIIDPRTGNPVKGIVSVTIVTDNATRADALSTGVFVLGLEKGMNLIEQLQDVEGIIIYEDVNSKLSTKTSSGMKALLKKNTSEAKESDAIMSGS